MRNSLKVVIQVGFWILAASAAQATEFDLSSKGGAYIDKGNGIVNIGGKTLVTSDKTRMISCEGKQVSRLQHKTKVIYETRIPDEGPIPMVTEIREICR